MAENLVRIPTADKREDIKAVFDEEDFKFQRIGTIKDPLGYKLPGKGDAVSIEKKFHAVIVLAKKDPFRDKDTGDITDRVLFYLLRPGKFVAEKMHVSPSGLRNWRALCAQLMKENKLYWQVMVEFTVEMGKSEKYTWAKAKFAIDRSLNKDELEWIEEYNELLEKHHVDYGDDSELAKAEEFMLGGGKYSAGGNEEQAIASAVRETVEDDEDEVKTRKKSTAKKKPVEEEEPKARKAAPVEDDDEDLDSLRKQNEEAPKAKKSAPVEDDDEDEAPPKAKKSAPVEDDDEDEAPPKAKTSAAKKFASLEDDDEA